MNDIIDIGFGRLPDRAGARLKRLSALLGLAACQAFSGSAVAAEAAPATALNADVAGSAEAEAEEDDKLPELAQELFLGEIVYPQDQYELQLTSGFRLRGQEGAARYEIPLSVELGLTDRFQIEAGVPLASVSGESSFGLANPELAVLYNFVNDPQRKLGFSAAIEGTAPAEEPRGEDAFGVEPVLIGYAGFGPVAFNLSVGPEISLPTESGAESEIGVQGAAGMLFTLGSVVPILECGLEAGEETELTAAAGAAWSPFDGFELSGAATFEPTAESRQIGAIFVLTGETSFGADDD